MYSTVIISEKLFSLYLLSVRFGFYPERGGVGVVCWYVEMENVNGYFVSASICCGLRMNL